MCAVRIFPTQRVRFFARMPSLIRGVRISQPLCASIYGKFISHCVREMSVCVRGCEPMCAASGIRYKYTFASALANLVFYKQIIIWYGATEKYTRRTELAKLGMAECACNRG